MVFSVAALLLVVAATNAAEANRKLPPKVQPATQKVQPTAQPPRNTAGTSKGQPTERLRIPPPRGSREQLRIPPPRGSREQFRIPPRGPGLNLSAVNSNTGAVAVLPDVGNSPVIAQINGAPITAASFGLPIGGPGRSLNAPVPQKLK
jgi:hypothetical protein